MSFLGRSLCFGDFTNNDRLPCETDLWDRGEVAPNEPLFVTSATSIKATPFGRLCQVALLLGRVINHRNDRQDATSAAKFVNAMQLQRTITALLRLVTAEFEQDPAAFCIPLAMGLSTKMVLCQIYSCNTHSPLSKMVEEADAQVAALTDLKTVPEEVASFHRRLTEQVDVSKIGPLICPCLYQAIVIITYFLRETCDRQLEKSRMPLINCLRILKGQWAVAGIYLDNVLSDNGISL
ncbi:hypothetical protein CFAM422_006082 [Trichoderma lentiforme]|uniref:Uncharacterized protein n=1 Tax=Trichoderma lentiforme TaxID=1567552 RepID=A0A9P4XFC5_9HYPO|nr:hypothetical protein CFAM422_006082 [Trichoderma lentiforme]